MRLDVKIQTAIDLLRQRNFAYVMKSYGDCGHFVGEGGHS